MYTRVNKWMCVFEYSCVYSPIPCFNLVRFLSFFLFLTHVLSSFFSLSLYRLVLPSPLFLSLFLSPPFLPSLSSSFPLPPTLSFYPFLLSSLTPSPPHPTYPIPRPLLPPTLPPYHQPPHPPSSPNPIPTLSFQPHTREGKRPSRSEFQYKDGEGVHESWSGRRSGWKRRSCNCARPTSKSRITFHPILANIT